MVWPTARFALLLALCIAITGPGLAPAADPVAAEALWQWALHESAGDFTHPALVDATEALSRLRPWHAGYSEAKVRIRQVGDARLARLGQPFVAGQASHEQTRFRSP